MSTDGPFAELADRLRAGYNRVLFRGTLAERRELLDRCTRFDRAGLLATPLEDARFIVIDTETTGFAAYAGAEIVQVALLEYRGLAPTGHEYTSLVRPQNPIPPASTAIHGIADAHVETAPRIEEIIDDVVNFIDHAVIVGHHVAFDIRFLNRVMHRCLFCRLPQPTIDTMLMYLAFAGRFGQYDLETVARACDVEAGVRHDAHGDAQTCARIFAQLAHALTEPGATVGGLIAASDARDDDGMNSQPGV